MDKSGDSTGKSASNGDLKFASCMDKFEFLRRFKQEKRSGMARIALLVNGLVGLKSSSSGSIRLWIS